MYAGDFITRVIDQISEHEFDCFPSCKHHLAYSQETASLNITLVQGTRCRLVVTIGLTLSSIPVKHGSV